MSKAQKFLDYTGEVLVASIKGVKGVIKTQLTLSLITFVVLSIGFIIIGIPLWGLIAFFIALVDLIPLLGSGIIMIPWGLVLLIIGKTNTAIYLLILYVIVFIARQILEPVLSGKSIGVKPLYSLLSTLVCSILFGPWGLLLGPVAAIIIKTIIDIKNRSEWNR